MRNSSILQRIMEQHKRSCCNTRRILIICNKRHYHVLLKIGEISPSSMVENFTKNKLSLKRSMKQQFYFPLSYSGRHPRFGLRTLLKIQTFSLVSLSFIFLHFFLEDDKEAQSYPGKLTLFSHDLSLFGLFT